MKVRVFLISMNCLGWGYYVEESGIVNQNSEPVFSTDVKPILPPNMNSNSTSRSGLLKNTTCVLN